MATFNELAMLIAEPLGRALDAPFKEMLKARMKYWRTRLLKNTLDKEPKDRKFFTSRFSVEMEEVSAVDCGIPLGCKVMRSKEKIPTPLRANGVLFDYIGSVDGFNAFRLVKRHELYFFLQDRYAPLVSSYASYENGYIVLPHNRLTPWVTLEYIVDDPAEIPECTGEGTSCAFEDAEYPVPGEIAQQIVQMILQVDFNLRQIDDKKTEVNVNSNDQ